jgi:ParB-like chromosome segregation protein Spo0J
VDSKLRKTITLYLHPRTEAGVKEVARYHINRLAKSQGMTFDQAITAYREEPETSIEPDLFWEFCAAVAGLWEEDFKDLSKELAASDSCVAYWKKEAERAPASIEPTGINVPDRLRPLNEERVVEIMESMRTVGQINSITVRIGAGEWLDLVTGRHRLEAAIRLGWKEISARVLECDDITARKLEIAENLHRAELTALERSEHVAEWIRLTKAQVEPSDHTGGRPDQGINEATRQGIAKSRADGQRAVKIDGLTEEAKEAARAAGLADNQSALLKVAAAPQADQVEAVAAIVAEKAKPKAKPVETQEPVTAAQIEFGTWQIFEGPEKDANGAFAITRESVKHPGYFDFLCVIPKHDGGAEVVDFRGRPVFWLRLAEMMRHASGDRLKSFDAANCERVPAAAFDVYNDTVNRLLAEVPAEQPATEPEVPAEAEEEAGGFAPGVLEHMQAEAQESAAAEQSEEEMLFVQERQPAHIKAAAYKLGKAAGKAKVFTDAGSARERKPFFDKAIADDDASSKAAA